MFHTISWQQYFFFIITAAVLYYIVIVLRFYNKELSQMNISRLLLLKKGINVSINGEQDKQPGKDVFDAIQVSHDEQQILFPLVHDLLEELSQVLSNAAQNSYLKEELFYAIHRALKNYAILSQSTVQVAINAYISEACKNKCSIQFSEDEVTALWMQ